MGYHLDPMQLDPIFVVSKLIDFFLYADPRAAIPFTKGFSSLFVCLFFVCLSTRFLEKY